jgi:hypothetical protein
MFYSIIAFLSLLIITLIYYCIKFAMIIINMQNVIEESLDIIDQKYFNLNKILETPLFYNNNEIKSVIEEIKETRDILLYIANQLVNNEEDIDDEPEDD